MYEPAPKSPRSTRASGAMRSGFLNAYEPAPKRPRSARATGEIVEDEIQPTAEEEIQPTQAGPGSQAGTTSQCQGPPGHDDENRTYKHTCENPNIAEGETAQCEKCGRMVGGIPIGPFEWDEEWARVKEPPHPDTLGKARLHVPVPCMPKLLANDENVLKVLAKSAFVEYEVQPEVEGADERDIIVTGKHPGILLFYENVYRNIHKELIEVASKPEKRHKILLEPYEMVKPIIGKKGRNHQAIVDITGAVVKIVEEPLPGQEFEEKAERERQGFRKPTGLERQFAEQDPFGGWRLVKAKQKDPIEPGDRKKDRTIVYFFNAVTGETRDTMPPKWKYPYQNHPKPEPKRKEPEPSSAFQQEDEEEMEEILADDPMET